MALTIGLDNCYQLGLNFKGNPEGLVCEDRNVSSTLIEIGKR